ncbi:hypothetical protein FM119_06100 [Mycetocola reblochoni REB411]|uniref:Uncharacterized protein n=1 Tax=Mycetocola reblochoni REB411 TaxID=1255698 RepID=A0A1R4JA26_9MICO|nr:hypothetical protein FM119_06100 [Mycetocola reblochoni REB411]
MPRSGQFHGCLSTTGTGATTLARAACCPAAARRRASCRVIGGARVGKARGLGDNGVQDIAVT